MSHGRGTVHEMALYTVPTFARAAWIRRPRSDHLGGIHDLASVCGGFRETRSFTGPVKDSPAAV